MNMHAERYVRDIMSSSKFRNNHEVNVYTSDGEKKYNDVDVIKANGNHIELFNKNDYTIATIYPGKDTMINNISASDYSYKDDEGSVSEPGCYLTTACVDYFGKADDCYELETLRSFRDGYMQTSSEMKQAAKKYYVIAPRIVAKINALPDKAIVYKEMYTNLVQRCINLINRGKNKQAYETYKNYSENLEKKYLN